MVTPDPPPVDRGPEDLDGWVVLYDNEEFGFDMSGVGGESPLGTSVTVTYGALLSALTLGMNLAAIVFIISRRHIREAPSALHIGNFFLANVLFGAVVIPMSVHKERVGRWTFGRVLCHFWLSAGVFLASLAAWTLCLVNLASALAVIFPQKYQRLLTRPRAAVSVAGAWVVSGVLLVPLLLSVFTDADFVLDEVCATSLSPQYAVGMACVVFFCPAFLVLMTNAMLVVSSKRRSNLRRRRRHTERHCIAKSETDRLAQSKCNKSITTNCTTNTAETTETADPKTGHELSRSLSAAGEPCTRSLLFLTVFNVCFIGAWLPSHVVNVRVAFCSDLCIDPGLWKAMVWLGYSSCALTPGAWFLLDPGVRRELRQLWSTARASCAKIACGGEKAKHRGGEGVDMPLTAAT